MYPHHFQSLHDIWLPPEVQILTIQNYSLWGGAPIQIKDMAWQYNNQAMNYRGMLLATKYSIIKGDMVTWPTNSQQAYFFNLGISW